LSTPGIGRSEQLAVAPKGSDSGASDLAAKIARAGSFDLMRLLFGFAVIWTHSIRFMEGRGHLDPMDHVFGVKSTWIYGLGDLAVDGFFALSGFLIAMSWARSEQLVAYLRNRVLRIYPGFAVASVVSLLVVAPLAAPSVEFFWNELSPLKALGHIFRLKPPEASVFLGTPHPTLNTSMWSISHEFRCYLLVAFLGIVLPRRFRLFAWSTILIGCVALLWSHWKMPSFPLRDTILGGGEEEARLVGSFAMGALYFHAFTYHHILKRGFPLLAAVALLCLFNEWTLAVAIPLVIAPFYLQVGLSSHLGRWIPKPPIDISYGVYLYGWPIQKLLLMWFPSIGLAPHILITIVLACGMGWLSWHLVESRFMRWKAR
jgi:peptidoglycan/LPS O-acetylase OafA/YrhL